MRWAARISLVFLVLLAVYTVWPFLDLYQIAQAIERRDAERLSARVEWRMLRGSINRQVLATYLRVTGKEARLGPFSDVAIGVAASVTDAALPDTASAERLLELFAEGWPRDTSAQAAAEQLAPLPRTLGTLWKLYVDSEYSLGDFYVSVPVALPPPERFRLQLRLTQWKWKLFAVQLPEELRLRLARELIKATDKR